MLKPRAATSAARYALQAGCLLASAWAADAGEVYKSVDAQGHVVYSDRATSPTAHKSEVTVVEGNPAEAARTARQTQLLSAQVDQARKLQSDADQTRASQDHDRQVRCEAARREYLSIKDANLLYKLDAQGNRQFYSDSEAEAHREKARAAMTAACGS